MTTIGLLHRDRRIRDLYEAVLKGRGYAVVAWERSEWRSAAAVGCDVLVVHVGDGASGLLAALEVVGVADVVVVAIDDDPELARRRALRVRGAERVLDGPVRLRDLVDVVEELAGTSMQPEAPPEQGRLRVLRDSAHLVFVQDVRGGQRRPGHHVVLAGDGLDVSLHSFRRGPGLRVVGTITGPAEPVLAEVRMDHASGIATARTDAHGRFILTEVTPGPVRLQVDGRCCSLTAEVEVGVG